MSIKATILYYMMWIAFYIPRNKTRDQQIKSIINRWKTQAGPVKLPKSIATDPSLVITEDVFTAPNSDQWQIYRVTPKNDKGGKVVLYIHGGGFIDAANPMENKLAIQQFAVKMGCTVILPHYTLAPLSCATEFGANILAFMLSIAQDPQYAGREFVIAGGSAGGWSSFKTLLELCRHAVQHQGPGENVAHLTLERLSHTILLSPVVDANPDGMSRSDNLLTPEAIELLAELWFRGPAAFPEIYDNIPKETQEKAKIWSKETEGADISDPRISIANDIGIFEEYAQAFPSARRPSIYTGVGSWDPVAIGCIRMHEKLGKMKAVNAELYLAEKMTHPFIALPIPEAAVFWKRTEELLK